MAEPYYATLPDTGRAEDVYRHHRMIAMRILGELRHRRWGGDMSVPVGIAQVHATLAQAAAFRELAARRNGSGGS